MTANSMSELFETNELTGDDKERTGGGRRKRGAEEGEEEGSEGEGSEGGGGEGNGGARKKRRQAVGGAYNTDDTDDTCDTVTTLMIE